MLTGRDRVRVLAHVESCPRCAEELEQLSRAADAVVQVAPEVEPPMGFEVRLFERMGVADVRRRRRVRPSRWTVGALAAAAAVAALAVGLSLGLSSSPSPTQSAHAGARRRDGQPGRARLGGRAAWRPTAAPHPWMSMMLVDSGAAGPGQLRRRDVRRRAATRSGPSRPRTAATARGSPRSREPAGCARPPRSSRPAGR